MSPFTPVKISGYCARNMFVCVFAFVAAYNHCKLFIFYCTFPFLLNVHFISYLFVFKVSIYRLNSTRDIYCI